MDSQQLKSLIASVKPGLGTMGPIEYAEMIVFRDDCIHTYNGNFGCVAESSLGLVGAADGARLSGFVEMASSEEITLKLRKNRLHLQNGNARARLPWKDDSPRPKFSKPKKWHKIAGDFANAISQASSCCAQHYTRPALTCVHVMSNYVEATDGHRAVRYTHSSALKGLNVLVPQYVAREVGARMVSSMGITVKGIHFLVDDDATVRVYCHRTDMDFPALSPLFKIPDGVTRFDLPLKNLKIALERAKVFAVGVSVVEMSAAMGDPFVEITVSADGIAVSTGEDHVGTYMERLKTKDDNVELPEISFHIKLGNLVDLVEKDLTHLSCAFNFVDRIWVEAEGWRYVSEIKKPREED